MYYCYVMLCHLLLHRYGLLRISLIEVFSVQRNKRAKLSKEIFSRISRITWKVVSTCSQSNLSLFRRLIHVAEKRMVDRSVKEPYYKNPARKPNKPIYKTLVRKNYLLSVYTGHGKYVWRDVSWSAIAELFQDIIGLRKTLVGELFIRHTSASIWP